MEVEIRSLGKAKSLCEAPFQGASSDFLPASQTADTLKQQHRQALNLKPGIPNPQMPKPPKEGSGNAAITSSYDKNSALEFGGDMV